MKKFLLCLKFLLMVYILYVICRNHYEAPATLPSPGSINNISIEEDNILLAEQFRTNFDLVYSEYLEKYSDQNIATGFRFYYFRQELQALVDMYQATGEDRYLRQALSRSLEAIDQARQNRKPLLRNGNQRGVWPCFHHPMVDRASGGHSQLNDFQGSAGLLIIARLLKEQHNNEWRTIADFVEQNIVEKWLIYNQLYTLQDFKTDGSGIYLLRILERARDKREHFACIALDLHALGYTRYPYEQWAHLLVKLYLSERPELEKALEDKPELRSMYDGGWGLTRQDSGALVWHWVLKRIFTAVQDTSHANRTVWLAAKAYDKKLISRDIIDGMLFTLKNNIHDPPKGAFYFRNGIDGSDKAIGKMEPGRQGNLWFGWHRLAVYDRDVRDLFISLAHDLSNGGPNIRPRNAQNRTMAEALLCFYAWATLLCMDKQG